MKYTKYMFEGYLQLSLLAKDLGIETKDFKNTVLDSIKFNKVTLIKVPLSAIRFIVSPEYTPALISPNDERGEYDYILTISKELEVGFWK